MLYQGPVIEEVAAFRKQVEAFQQDLTATTSVLSECNQKIEALAMAATRVDQIDPTIIQQIYQAKQKILDLEKKMNGDPVRDEVGELYENTPRSMMYLGVRALRTTYGPTEMHKEGIKLGVKKLALIKSELSDISKKSLPEIEKELKQAGAPWIEGQGLISN